MTRAKRRHFISSFTEDKANVPMLVYQMLETVDNHRFTSFPEEVYPGTTLFALCNYGDVLLFEMCMVVRGDTLKDAAQQFNIPYRKLLRAVKFFNRGVADGTLYLPHRINAYIAYSMIKYCSETKEYIERQMPENQMHLWNEKRGLN